jgi:hypothetical protein
MKTSCRLPFAQHLKPTTGYPKLPPKIAEAAAHFSSVMGSSPVATCHCAQAGAAGDNLDVVGIRQQSVLLKLQT